MTRTAHPPLEKWRHVHSDDQSHKRVDDQRGGLDTGGGTHWPLVGLEIFSTDLVLVPKGGFLCSPTSGHDPQINNPKPLGWSLEKKVETMNGQGSRGPSAGGCRALRALALTLSELQSRPGPRDGGAWRHDPPEESPRQVDGPSVLVRTGLRCPVAEGSD